MSANPINIKPIIREIVRTQVCFPDIRLLVDRVSIIKLPDIDEVPGLQAYRLYLTDREKTIQAVVKRRLHRAINHGEIQEGSFVVLRDYQLARGKRLNAGGEVIYLKIADFYSIGEEERHCREIAVVEILVNARPVLDARREYSLLDNSLEEGANKRLLAIGPTAQKQTHPNYEGPPAKPPTQYQEDVAVVSQDGTPCLNETHISQTGKRDSALSELDSNPRKRVREIEESSSTRKNETYTDSQAQISRLGESNSAPRQRNSAELESDHPDSNLAKDEGHFGDESMYIAARDFNAASELVSKFSTSVSAPISRPLKLSMLASVTGTNRSKNEIHDVLALITHVDAHTYKPPRMPRKRDLRIIDTSTSKRVVLSVFTDPVGFAPKAGTVALFRNLTTHDWDGGNLKAYPWLCEGRAWFVPVPDDGVIEGVVIEDIERLRELRDSMTSST